MGESPDDDEKLSPKERACAGVVAGLTLAAGTVSVFTDMNEVGTGALILVGGAFALASITGQTIRRFKIGDNEAEFNRRVTRKLADTVAADTSESEAAARILEEVASETPQAPARVLNTTNAFHYERAVIEALRRVSPNVRMLLDDVVDAIAGGKVAVVIKYRVAGRPPGVRALERPPYHGFIERAASVGGVRAVLLVTNSVVAEDANSGGPALVPTAVAGDVAVRLVQWAPHTGDEALAEALEQLEAFEG